VAPRTQSIFGDGDAPAARHTVILFDEATALDVIPGFAAIARESLAELDRPPTVKAVAARKRPAGTGAFPDALAT
jgi:hypothetical protein